MSWSKTSSGAPAEIAEVIANAIRNSVDYQPPSVARQRTGELVATSAKKIILAAASDDVRTINESGNIAVESYGHINDDGSLSFNKLSISVLPVVRQFHAEPAKPVPGPDAVTHEEVDAALAQVKEGELADLEFDAAADARAESEVGNQDGVGDPTAPFEPPQFAEGAFEATADQPAGVPYTPPDTQPAGEAGI